MVHQVRSGVHSHGCAPARLAAAEAQEACRLWLARLPPGAKPGLQELLVRTLRAIVAARYAELALGDYVAARTAGDLERAGRIADRLRGLLPVIEGHRAWSQDVWVQSCLIPLALGDFEAAESRLDSFVVERWKLLLRAELALCRGQLAQVFELLAVPPEAREPSAEPYLPSEVDWVSLHARAVLAHAYALQGRPCPLPETEGLLIPWRTPERLRRVIEGSCWWPGQERAR